MLNENNEIAIVYMVGGISSRFGGKIKQFAQVGPNGETLIEISMQQAIKAGFSKIIFVVSNKTEFPFKKKFKSLFKNIPVLYALQSYDENQRDRPWGTAEALTSAIQYIKSSFVICNGDDLYGENSFKILHDHLKKLENKEEASLGYSLSSVLPKEGKINRAIFQLDNNNVKEIKEYLNISNETLSTFNLSPTSLCSMNIFAMHPETAQKLTKRVEIFKTLHKGDRKSECLLPEELSNLIKNNEIKMQIYPSIDKWIGITNPGDEITVKDYLRSTILIASL